VPSHFSQRSCRAQKRRTFPGILVLVQRSPFAVHPNISGRPRPLLLTEPRHTSKILSLQRRNDGRGRPSHIVETRPSCRAALEAQAIPYY
jgi:hypothetical protein